jgi:hypothetical protein
MASERQRIMGLQLTESSFMDLEALVDGIRETVEEGAKIVSFGPREDTTGVPVLTLWHSDGSESYLYPDILRDLLIWLEGLPRQPPEEW